MADIFDRMIVKEEGITPDVETEIKTEPVVETQTPVTPIETQTTETQVPVTEQPEYVKKLSELSGGSFTFNNEDEVKQFFETHKKVSSEYEGIKSRAEQFDEAEKFFDSEEVRQFDPVSRLGGEENYRKFAIAKELEKTIGTDAAFKVVGGIDNLDPFETIELYNKFRAPGMTSNKKIEREIVLEEIGVNLDDVEDIFNVELSEKQKRKLELKVLDIKGQLNKAMSDIDVPVFDNPLKSRIQKLDERKANTEKLKTQWTTEAKTLEASLDKLSFKDVDFDFDIPVEDKKIIDVFINEASKLGIEPNDANKLTILSKAKEAIRDKNFDNIFKAYKSNLRFKLEKEFDAKYHNLTPLNTDKQIVQSGDSSQFESALRRNLLK